MERRARASGRRQCSNQVAALGCSHGPGNLEPEPGSGSPTEKSLEPKEIVRTSSEAEAKRQGPSPVVQQRPGFRTSKVLKKREKWCDAMGYK